MTTLVDDPLLIFRFPLLLFVVSFFTLWLSAWIGASRACSHYPQPIGDECEVDEGHEHEIEFLEPREDAAKALESTEQPFDLIAPLVHDTVVFPRRHSILLGWYDGDEAKIERQLPRLVAFVCPVHQQVQRPRRLAQIAQQFAPLRRVVRLAGRQRERYGRSSIRGNHMNLGGPSAAGLADGLGAVFFRAPVPSGCTLTAVLSMATASILIRTI